MECSGDVNGIEARNTLLRNLRDVSESRQLVPRIDAIVEIVISKFSFEGRYENGQVHLDARVMEVQRERFASNERFAKPGIPSEILKGRE